MSKVIYEDEWTLAGSLISLLVDELPRFSKGLYKAQTGEDKEPEAIVWIGISKNVCMGRYEADGEMELFDWQEESLIAMLAKIIGRMEAYTCDGLLGCATSENGGYSAKEG